MFVSCAGYCAFAVKELILKKKNHRLELTEKMKNKI